MNFSNNMTSNSPTLLSEPSSFLQAEVGVGSDSGDEEHNEELVMIARSHNSNKMAARDSVSVPTGSTSGSRLVNSGTYRSDCDLSHLTLPPMVKFHQSKRQSCDEISPVLFIPDQNLDESNLQEGFERKSVCQFKEESNFVDLRSPNFTMSGQSPVLMVRDESKSSLFEFQSPSLPNKSCDEISPVLLSPSQLITVGSCSKEISTVKTSDCIMPPHSTSSNEGVSLLNSGASKTCSSRNSAVLTVRDSQDDRVETSPIILSLREIKPDKNCLKDRSTVKQYEPIKSPHSSSSDEELNLLSWNISKTTLTSYSPVLMEQETQPSGSVEFTEKWIEGQERYNDKRIGSYDGMSPVLLSPSNLNLDESCSTEVVEESECNLLPTSFCDDSPILMDPDDLPRFSSSDEGVSYEKLHRRSSRARNYSPVLMKLVSRSGGDDGTKPGGSEPKRSSCNEPLSTFSRVSIEYESDSSLANSSFSLGSRGFSRLKCIDIPSSRYRNRSGSSQVIPVGESNASKSRPTDPELVSHPEPQSSSVQSSAPRMLDDIEKKCLPDGRLPKGSAAQLSSLMNYLSSLSLKNSDDASSDIAHSSRNNSDDASSEIAHSSSGGVDSIAFIENPLARTGIDYGTIDGYVTDDDTFSMASLDSNRLAIDWSETAGNSEVDLDIENTAEPDFEIQVPLTSMIPEIGTLTLSSEPEVICRLPVDEKEVKCVEHVNHCEIRAQITELQSKNASLFQSINSVSVPPIINAVIGKGNCLEHVLNPPCTNQCCFLIHEFQFKFDTVPLDRKASLVVFTSWFIFNSTKPNFRMLMSLLEFVVTQDLGDDMLVIILWFSKALLKLEQPNRRSLGTILIDKLINLLKFSQDKAIRTILIFNISHVTEDNSVNDLLDSLGIYERDMTMFETLSCIWHVNDNYSYPNNVLFSILSECLLEMPADLVFTKEKIIRELLKCPRNVLYKQLIVIERFLNKYFPINSFAAHKVKTAAMYGVITDTEEDPTRKSYHSSPVKGFGSVNYGVEYLDTKEERRQRMLLRINQLSQDCLDDDDKTEASTDEEAPIPLKPLINNGECDLSFLSKPQFFSVKMDQFAEIIREILLSGRYDHLVKSIIKHAESNYFRFYVKKLSEIMLEMLADDELPKVVEYCLKRVSSRKKKFPFLRDDNDDYDFIQQFPLIFTTLALSLYAERDHDNALLMLEMLERKRLDPMQFVPDERRKDEQMNEQKFAVIVSDIYFEGGRYQDALSTLSKFGGFRYVRYNGTFVLSDNYPFIQRLLLRMMEFSIERKYVNLGCKVFKHILEAQEDLMYPIDISVYYESLLRATFNTEGCSSNAAAKLVLNVYDTCRYEEKFSSSTYRSLIVQLVRLEDKRSTRKLGSYETHKEIETEKKLIARVMKRLLNLSIHYEVYPSLDPSSFSIDFGSHLILEEMYVYLCFSFEEFNRRSDVSPDQNCIVKLIPTHKLTEGDGCLKELLTVDEEVDGAMKRLKKALQLVLAPSDNHGVEMNEVSSTEIVIKLKKPPLQHPIVNRKRRRGNVHE